MAYDILVAEPSLTGNEETYVREALATNWVSSGPFVDRFERDFGTWIGGDAVATCNGTAALHLALVALGVGPGDEVIVPALTFVATANAVTYTGATPIFCDVDSDTWCVAPARLSALRTRRTKAIIPVSLFGYPVDIAAIRDAVPDVPIVEDACEALGAVLRERPAGSQADLGVFSFHAAKSVTTCEGGAIVVPNSPDLLTRIRLLASNGQRDVRYVHEVTGFNYRMSDLHAAVGCAQLERLDWHLGRRAQAAKQYREMLPPSVTMQQDPEDGKHGRWAMAVQLPAGASPTQMAEALRAEKIETRPFFYPLPDLPMWGNGHTSAYPVARHLYQHGIILPLHANLRQSHIARICTVVTDLCR